MPRGLPDDSNIVKHGPTWTLTDHGELAARLGSIVRFDRLGTVIDLDTFVKGRSRWHSNTVGVGASVDLSNFRSEIDGVSLKLTSGTNPNPQCMALWYLPYPELTRLGFEASYAFSGTNYRMYHAFNVFDGTNYAYYALRWTLTTGVIEYRNVAGGWTDSTYNVIPAPHNYLFNKVKLVANTLTHEYERVIINDEGFTLHGLQPEEVISGDDPHIQAWAQVYGNGIVDAIAYMDCAIFTETEPATP